MKEYIMKTVAGPAVNWDEIEAADVNNYLWDNAYMPKTYARACVIEGKGIAFKAICYEENPKAVYHNFYDDVYKDSCLEFFFGFEHLGVYINCEMNANGACLIGVGDNRHGRTRLDEIITPPNIGAVKGDGFWSVEVFFSLEVLKAVFGDKVCLDKGTVLWGNMYKCGDECVSAHHGMWNVVEVDAPDFHRPEHFGKLIIG